MAEHLFKNNIILVLNEPGGLGTGDTTWTVDDASGLPAISAGQSIIGTAKRQSDSALEVIAITAVSGNDLTVTRAQDGTSALTFDDDDTIELRITAGILQNFPQLGKNNTYTKAQRGAKTTMTDGATITPDFAASNNHKVTLAGNRTLANPTNIAAEQSGYIEIVQDGTGSRTLALGSYYKTPGGAGITLSTAAGAVDTLEYRVRSATEIDIAINKDWS